PWPHAGRAGAIASSVPEIARNSVMVWRLLLIIASGSEMFARKVPTIGRAIIMDAWTTHAIACSSTMIARGCAGWAATSDRCGLAADGRVPFAGGCLPASDGHVLAVDE